MDGILGVGPLELIIIVVLALVILGPERLPDTIRTVVKFIRRARAIGNELTTQFSEELNLLDDFNPKKILEDVAGLEKDEKFDAKSFLGIDKDDLKVGIDDDKKANAKSTAKKPSVSASSTAKKTKPALGEIDPEETSAVDAVVEEPPSDSPKTTDNAAKADVSNGDSSVAKVSEAEPNSIGGSIKPSESVSANGGTSKARADLSKKQVESDVVESVTENSIAPPSMTSTQSFTDKTSSSEERNNATEKLADVVAEEVSKNAVVESNLPADVDPEVTKDAGEV